MNTTSIIENAVINGITVNSSTTSRQYNVCDLMKLDKDSFEALYIGVNRLLEGYQKGGLWKNYDKKTQEVMSQKTLLEEIFKIRRQKEDQEKTQKTLQKQADKMRAIFMSAQDEKQIQRIKSLSQEDFDKEMAKWMDE